jgi:hypothetical protein
MTKKNFLRDTSRLFMDYNSNYNLAFELTLFMKYGILYPTKTRTESRQYRNI